ncbi:NAD+ synthase [Candidatus Aerophobetes bacterium]|nr:NAD+ synthase [Candidatus Aerophobetes bacterium]
MKLSEKIAKWIKDKVQEAGAEGVVFGLSGGLDSSVVACLVRKALEDKALGLIMPCHSDPTDEKYALLVAKRFSIRTRRVDLGAVYEEFLKVLPPGRRVSLANLKPRLRMITLYYFANELNYLVAGTGNKSEISTGYFTKYGDGGVDILPIGGLLKTQVRKLAKELRIPEEIIRRAPTAGLWEGQTDEDELGLSYEDLDRAILAIESGRRGNLASAIMDKVEGLIKRSAHKRSPIPVFKPEERLEEGDKMVR